MSETEALRALQLRVSVVEKLLGFEGQTIIQKTLWLVEEVGELVKAISTREGLKDNRTINRDTVEEEIADVLICIAHIANRYDIDLVSTAHQKMNVYLDRREIEINVKGNFINRR